MSKMIFVNLPVADVAKAIQFYQAIGCVHDTSFCKGPEAAMLVWSDTITFMLLSHEHFARFISKEIPDAHKSCQVLLALSRDNREEVDQITQAALAAGGRETRDPQDYGFMYGRAFEDLDGHIFEPMWMDAEAAMATMNQQTEAA